MANTRFDPLQFNLVIILQLNVCPKSNNKNYIRTLNMCTEKVYDFPIMHRSLLMVGSMELMNWVLIPHFLFFCFIVSNE